MAALILLLVLGTALLPLRAAVALADDGPPQVLVSAAGRPRPSETIERIASPTARSALVTVRGYGAAASDRGYWQGVFAATPDLLHLDYGTDFGRYDTRGSLSANGGGLRRSIQRLVREEDVDNVTILSVSQGGLVADEAFRSGLSLRDNVSAWTTLASPLNGSSMARIIRGADYAASVLGAHEELNALVRPFHADLDDPALADLAKSRTFTPPSGVTFTQFWSVSDHLVWHRDAVVPDHTEITPVDVHATEAVNPMTRPAVIDAVRGRRSPVQAVETTALGPLAPLSDLVRDAFWIIVAAAFVVAAFAISLASRFGARWR